jgi:hypothetical protein
VDRISLSAAAFSPAHKPHKIHKYPVNLSAAQPPAELETEQYEDELVNLPPSQPPMYLTTQLENRPVEATTQINEENRKYINLVSEII